jgi:hypothetical protein
MILHAVPNFTANAIQMCGQTALLLGWRPDDFWNATPSELQHILAAMIPQNPPPLDAAIINKLREQFPDG